MLPVDSKLMVELTAARIIVVLHSDLSSFSAAAMLNMVTPSLTGGVGYVTILRHRELAFTNQAYR